MLRYWSQNLPCASCRRLHILENSCRPKSVHLSYITWSCIHPHTITVSRFGKQLSRFSRTDSQEYLLAKKGRWIRAEVKYPGWPAHHTLISQPFINCVQRQSEEYTNMHAKNHLRITVAIRLATSFQERNLQAARRNTSCQKERKGKCFNILRMMHQHDVNPSSNKISIGRDKRPETQNARGQNLAVASSLYVSRGLMLSCIAILAFTVLKINFYILLLYCRRRNTSLHFDNRSVDNCRLARVDETVQFPVP